MAKGILRTPEAAILHKIISFIHDICELIFMCYSLCPLLLTFIRMLIYFIYVMVLDENKLRSAEHKGCEGRRRKEPVRNEVKYGTPQQPDPKGYALIKIFFCIFAPLWQIRIL